MVVLDLKYPIACGVIEDWDVMEKVWHYTFYTLLGITPSEVKGVLINVTPLSPFDDIKDLTRIMFEAFEVRSLYIANASVMSLLASGRSSGIVVDSGYDVSYSSPIFEGFIIKQAFKKMEIAGSHITEYC